MIRTTLKNNNEMKSQVWESQEVVLPQEGSSTLIDNKLALIRQMLRKRKANIELNLTNPSGGKCAITCKINDFMGREVLKVVDTEQFSEEKSDVIFYKDKICAKLIDEAFEAYMELITLEMRNIIEENGLRVSTEAIEQMENAIRSTFEKSVVGESYITEFNFGSIIKLKVIISSNERNMMDFAIQTKEGVVIFHESRICTKKFDINVLTQLLYTVSESYLLTNHCNK